MRRSAFDLQGMIDRVADRFIGGHGTRECLVGTARVDGRQSGRPRIDELAIGRLISPRVTMRSVPFDPT